MNHVAATLRSTFDPLAETISIEVEPMGATLTEAVRLASKATWGVLLQAGVEIYVYQPTMLHTKLLIIDGEMVSVGSTNFDPRSFVDFKFGEGAALSNLLIALSFVFAIFYLRSTRRAVDE